MLMHCACTYHGMRSSGKPHFSIHTQGCPILTSHVHDTMATIHNAGHLCVWACLNITLSMYNKCRGVLLQHLIGQ
jgi:hypothetical protein